jgi:kumamolisin
MKFSLATVLSVVLVLTGLVTAQVRPVSGKVVIPDSSIEKPGDIGQRFHTNIRFFVPAHSLQNAQPFGPPFPGLGFETPASLACVYSLVAKVVGCNPNTATLVPLGGSKVIAIVDAFDAPGAASDLAAFSTQFGLPAPNFQKVFASGVQPPNNAGWEIEESLDIQWAHAMAPQAKIILVEAASNSLTDLLQAEDVASTMVAAAGGGEVSNSWGGSEFSGEVALDTHFSTANVVYFASSGDSPGTSWPSVAPQVVSAGGTTVRRNPSTFNFMSEAPWDSAGGGRSTFEARPSYQSAISTIVGTKRGTPDLSFDSNPITGVWVLDTHQGGWFIVGGTSVASPSLAGIINLAGGFAASTNAELTTIYGNMAVLTDFKDITSSFCGPFGGFSAIKGWDFCTGVGVNKGKIGK